MKQTPEKNENEGIEDQIGAIAAQLLAAKGRRGIRSPHIWIIAAIFAAFVYVYYEVLTSYHDIYVIIFFYPLLYAAIVYRVRGVVTASIICLAILVPQAFFLSGDMLALTRTLLFAIFAFIVSGLSATLLNFLEHQAEAYRDILSLNRELNEHIEKLQKAQQQLLHAARLSSIGQLAAAVAHELNNPLAGVLVYTKLMKEKLGRENLDRDQLKSQLIKIEGAVEHASSIVRGLLDFARQSPPRLGPVTVPRAIDKAMALVGHQAKMKNIEVVRQDASALPLVVADFNQLVQVFVNLIVNAIQAMGEGGRLTVRTVPDDGWVKIVVQDTGCGIPPENLEKLFTPFFSTKDEVKGVGLGLAVSLGIVERHGGRIEVESEVGRGSTFTVVLPAHREGTGAANTGG